MQIGESDCNYVIWYPIIFVYEKTKFENIKNWIAETMVLSQRLWSERSKKFKLAQSNTYLEHIKFIGCLYLILLFYACDM